MSFDIQIDDREIRRLENDVSQDVRTGVKRAQRRALSLTRRKSGTLVSGHVRETYNIQARRLKRDVVLTRANYSSMSFRVIGRPGPISTIRFRGKAGPARKTQRGVSVAVKIGERRVIRSAFKATALGGNEQIMSRFAPDGTPLPFRTMRRGRYAGQRKQVVRVVKGPSAANMLFETEVDEPLAAEATTVFLSEVDRQLRLFLRR